MPKYERCKDMNVQNFAHSHTCRSAKFRTFTYMWEYKISHIHTLARFCKAIMVKNGLRMCRSAKVWNFAPLHMCGCENECAMCVSVAENFRTLKIGWELRSEVWEQKRCKIQSCNLLPLRPQNRHPVHPPTHPRGFKNFPQYPGASN